MADWPCAGTALTVVSVANAWSLNPQATDSHFLQALGWVWEECPAPGPEDRGWARD